MPGFAFVGLPAVFQDGSLCWVARLDVLCPVAVVLKRVGFLNITGSSSTGGSSAAEGLADGDMDGERLPVVDGEGDADGVAAPVEGEALGEAEATPADGEGDADGLVDGDCDSDGLADGEELGEGLTDGDNEGLALGDGLVLGLSEGLADGEGEAEGLILGLNDIEAEGLILGLAEGLADGEGEAEGLTDRLALGLND